ncbi:MAG: ABC transporter permease [Mycoplasmatales bacterium]
MIVISSMLLFAAPLICAALGGLFSEKSGVVNIGLEGMMTFGAFSGTLFVLYFEALGYSGSLFIILGLIIGAIGGGVFALLHSFLVINLKLDQIISGTIINIVTLGIGVFISKAIYGTSETPRITYIQPKIEGIPVVTFIVFIFVIIAYFVFKNTKFGTHITACGENPEAAASMGINVIKIRYLAVIISGLFAGVAGFIVVITTSNVFAPITISGAGFIAIAVLIFGQWNAKGVLLAGLFFGFTRSLAIISNVLFPELGIPVVYFEIVPYFITILALLVFSRTAVAPKALGRVYEKQN